MNSMIAVAGIVLALILGKHIARDRHAFLRAFAWCFFFLASAIMACYFLRLASGNTWPSIRPVLNVGIQVGDWIWFFLLGVAVTMIGRHNTEGRTLSVIRWAVVVRIAGFFAFVTLGKYRHLDEMILFFTSSGYSESFLYAIMILECVGVLGVMLDDYFRAGVFAATGLLMLMAGAVITHARNGDPLSDSDDAFRQITGLVGLIIIFFFERGARRKRTHVATA